MILRLLFVIIISTSLSCSKKEELGYDPTSNKNPYELYNEGLEEFEKRFLDLAQKRFESLK